MNGRSLTAATHQFYGEVKMLNYKFVTIDLDRGLLTRKPSRDYHAVIEEHARQGWRLVQIFAPPVYGYGKAVFYELIFERVNE